MDEFGWASLAPGDTPLPDGINATIDVNEELDDALSSAVLPFRTTPLFNSVLPTFVQGQNVASSNTAPPATKPSKTRASKHPKCKHNTFKSSCKTCSKTSFCAHVSRETSSGLGRRRRDCKQCGNTYCKHNRPRKICKESECLPFASMLCGHKQRKGSCPTCDACAHGLIKDKCMTCSPARFCEHGKSKYTCGQHKPPCPHGVKWFKKCVKCLV